MKEAKFLKTKPTSLVKRSSLVWERRKEKKIKITQSHQRVKSEVPNETDHKAIELYQNNHQEVIELSEKQTN